MASTNNPFESEFTVNPLVPAANAAIFVGSIGTIGTLIKTAIKRFGTSEMGRQKVIKSYRSKIADYKEIIKRTDDKSLKNKLEKKVLQYSAVLKILENHSLKEARKVIASDYFKQAMLKTAKRSAIAGAFGAAAGHLSKRAMNRMSNAYNPLYDEFYKKYYNM